jgi:N-methylhydantoinase A
MLEEQALEKFNSEGIDRSRVRFVRYGRLRYQNQAHSVEVDLPADLTGGAPKVDEIRESFRTNYEREYTYRLDAPVDLVSFHVVAIAEVDKLQPQRIPVTDRRVEDAVKEQREVDYLEAGIHKAVIYNGALLEPGMRFSGPSIIEEAGDTIAVMPGMPCSIDEYGNIHIQTG